LINFGLSNVILGGKNICLDLPVFTRNKNGEKTLSKIAEGFFLVL